MFLEKINRIFFFSILIASLSVPCLFLTSCTQKQVVQRGVKNLILDNTSHNGEADAFRHFVWAGLLTRDLGEPAARKFLDTHELSPGQPLEEEVMDKFNNERGINAGLEMSRNRSFENQELFNSANRELNDGKLRVLRPGQQSIVPLDRQ